MKKIVLAILTFIMSLNVFSQTDAFKVKDGSFHKIEGCITIPARYDDNDAAMAVVKIIPENINEQDRVKLYFEGNLATFIEVEQNIGETWVYLTAEAATFLRIKHPDFGVTEYWFPMDLKPRQCYELVLQNNNVAPASSNTSLIIDTEPSGADIYIDGKHYGQTPNIVKGLPAGKYEMKLEKQDYNPLTRIFVIDDDEKISFNETLSSVYYKGETQKITYNRNDNKETFATNYSEENETISRTKENRKALRENPKRKGFYVMPEVGVGITTGENFTWKMQGIFGYYFNNHLSVGIGTGLSSLELYDNINIPLFVNVSGDMTKKAITPYYDIDCGYSLCLNTDTYFQEGIIISAGFGLRIIKCYIGCEFLITESHYYDYHNENNYEDYGECNISLKFGYKIPFKRK